MRGIWGDVEQDMQLWLDLEIRIRYSRNLYLDVILCIRMLNDVLDVLYAKFSFPAKFAGRRRDVGAPSKLSWLY
jgi:hypothetical protein